MTNKNIHIQNNTLRNVIKSSNKIKLNIYQGAINGNIIKEEIKLFTECEQNAFDFQCEINSQYIPLV